MFTPVQDATFFQGISNYFLLVRDTYTPAHDLLNECYCLYGHRRRYVVPLFEMLDLTEDTQDAHLNIIFPCFYFLFTSMLRSEIR